MMTSPWGMSHLHANNRLNWPDKQGPDKNSHVPAEESAGLPVEWDESTGKNILFKVPLEGLGNSTPIIGHGRVWLTSAAEDGSKQWVYCFDEQTGKLLHHKLLFENAEPEPLFNTVNTYASPSCALESDAVYVHFGTYGTARLNPETGDVVWSRRDMNCLHFRGPGSSPVIWNNLLFLTFDGIDHQFVVALDKRTGETIWKVNRSTNFDDLDQQGKPRANGDYRKAYVTPTLAMMNGRMQLLSPGAKAIFGYDALTGKEIWTMTYPTINAACRPIVHDGGLIIHSGSVRARIYRIRFDETTLGDVTATHIQWEREKLNPEMASPVLIGDKVYMVTTNGVAICLNAYTGEEISKYRIGGTFVSTPIVANGLIYFSSEEGQTTVMKASPEFDIVAKNQIDDGIRASFGVSKGAIWLRSYHNLYKIAEK